MTKEKYFCGYCKKELQLNDLVVLCENDKLLFCGTEHSPLEPESCALKHAYDNPSQQNKSYFFIKIEEWQNHL